MTFAWPHLLWLLALPAALALWELLRHTRAPAATPSKILRAEAGAAHLSLVTSPSSLRRGAVRWRLCLALAAAFVALARPQWGRLDEPVFEQSREILIGLDLSRSMLATDVKPDRLDRAKLLITSLLENLRGERVGLALFSGTAFLQSPLSADYEVLREFLPELNPDYLPEGGTDYEELLDTALSSFSDTAGADRFLIILSDGEAQSDSWRQRLPALKAKGIRVISLGIGTAAGSMIPDPKNGGFVKDDRGAVVMSKLNTSTLEDLARETGGTYRDASTWIDLAQLIQSTVDQGRAGNFKEKNSVRLVERFQWALAPALLFALFSFWREFPVHPRSRAIKLAPRRAATPPPLPAATTALLLLFAFHFFFVPPRASAASLVPAPSSPPPPAARIPSVGVPAPGDASAAPAPGNALTDLVGKLSAAPSLDAKNYADLARATIDYGDQLKTTGQPPPSGAIEDGLSAVAAGRALDPANATWDDLQQKLEALQKKPPPQKQDQKKPDQKDQDKKKDDQNKDGSGQGGSDDQQKDQNKSDQQKDQGQSGDDQNSQNGQSSPGKNDDQPRDQQGQPKTSAFGKMDSPSDPAQLSQPSNPQDMQQVGGVSDQQASEAAKRDPALALSMQKLDQLKRTDSPAKLFQMMQSGEPTEKAPAPTAKGQNW